MGMLADALGKGFIGPYVGKAISATVRFNDIRVDSLLDLTPGDHVVFLRSRPSSPMPRHCSGSSLPD